MFSWPAMCHHHEALVWAAVGDVLGEAEPDVADDETPRVEPTTAADDGPEPGDRLPPISPSD